MRILSASAENFGSYKTLEFNFENQGLALIQGPTGSGKSTLADLVPWVLFGKTAKGGGVDEIIGWNTSGNTYGKVTLECRLGIITVTRARKPNDLYWQADAVPQRGKDLTDTQRLLNQALGCTYDTFIAGSYYHEFSSAAGFFTATAKNRRTLTEGLVDLSLATRLQAPLADHKRQLKNDHAHCYTELDRATHMLDYKQAEMIQKNHRASSWEAKHNEARIEAHGKMLSFESVKLAKITQLEEQIANFPHEVDTAALEAHLAETRQAIASIANETCGECGANIAHETVAELKEEVSQIKMAIQKANSNQERLATLAFKLELAHKETNTWQDRINELDAQVNPYQDVDSTSLEELHVHKSVYSDMLAVIQQQLTDLESLEDFITEYRTTTVKNTVSMLQHNTNQLLTDHFDAEIQVAFTAEDADKLDTTITKDGNDCAFTQLSKGQRQLLKLCFGVSVMVAVANHAGVDFNLLFLDEAVEGLDESLKAKAYGLLAKLATNHESVLVVEHSEALKSMFLNKFTVSLTDGASSIEKA